MRTDLLRTDKPSIDKNWNDLENDHIGFYTWMFMLGESRRDLDKCEKMIEEFINSKEFDESKEIHRKVLNAWLELQHIVVFMGRL